MNDAKDEIRMRLAVEDVVGQYIELKKAGRNFSGRSPWGEDRTPSLIVSPEKGIWHDFSANKGGDIFTFVMEVEGISFREALEKLALQAGVELTKYQGGDRKVAALKKRAAEALELSCKFYQFCLSKNKEVCEYVFYQRNMNRATVKEFRIGYAPKSGKMLRDFLKKRGFTEEEMRAAGLLNQYGGDFFKNRMAVPFIDINGVIGFTARVLDKSNPKYVNTKDTLLFNKSRFIFGLAQAKEAIRRNGFVVIVEGNMDVISSHQAGVKEAVATSGTAMTEWQIKTLAKLTNDVRLAYDGDEAGVRATERAIKIAGELGVKLSVVSDYGDAKDPDELIRRDVKLWQEAVKNKVPAVRWVLDKYMEKLDLTTEEGKVEYAKVARGVIGLLSDKVQQKHNWQLVAKRLDVEVEDLISDEFSKKKRVTRKKKVQTKIKNNKIEGIEKNLLALTVYGGVQIGDIEIPDDDMMLAELELVFNEKYKNWTQEEMQKEGKELERERRKIELKSELDKIQEELAEEETEEKILNYMRVRKELDALDKL